MPPLRVVQVSAGRQNHDEQQPAGGRYRALGGGAPSASRKADRTVPHEIPIEGELDLHTFHPRDIPSVVEEYIRAAHAAGFREVRLIHGRGRGIQRGIVQQALERHVLVEEFWDAPESHLGATVARLLGRGRTRSSGNVQPPTSNSQ